MPGQVEVPGQVEIEGLTVDAALHRFLVDEALPGSGVEPAAFWRGLADLVEAQSEPNRRLLERRAELQQRIDTWHDEHAGQHHDPDAYRAFLEEIGYLQPEGPDFEIDTADVDPEIAEIAGPQLVVPATNPRYALNAANARWGSLYDALYGTDAVDGTPPPPGPYDEARGSKVIAWVRHFLDEVLPLADGSHAGVVGYAAGGGRLEARFADGSAVGLRAPSAFAGYNGDPAAPSSILLRNHGLHVELVVDRRNPVGASDRAGIADVRLESAPTVIVDLEDSVATVDGEDKVAAYRCWLGLMRGDLEATFTKDGRQMTRRLAEDRRFSAPDGSELRLAGRALLLVRNVGHLMTTPAVLDRRGQPVFEGLLDAIVTVLIGLHDRTRAGGERNSRSGSIYVVKPKMHGPEEAAFADAVFAQVEDVLGLRRNTVKIGLMDEERRTSLNLKACIRAVRSRLAFINTGFLDRTGDEIHTSMRAGVMVRKAQMRKERWFVAYEDANVDTGLACGLRGRAQIGKGMWVAADLMAQMLEDKIAHPRAGASCAWVPSPTAATLHATHYHQVDVAAEQQRLAGKHRTQLDDLLVLPLHQGPPFGEDEVRAEVENNAQGILGYVARWVGQGVGCSKVPDIHDVALMEDRATCRISAQHIANWLWHGVVSTEMVAGTFAKMAAIVDRQNDGDPAYVRLSGDFGQPAFKAACELALLGADQPSGYTEPILHAWRIEEKARDAAGGARDAAGGASEPGANEAIAGVAETG